MHNGLSPAELNKLVGVLGRLGSDHDGERAAAGLLASKMLRDRGLSWDDLLRQRDAIPQVRWSAPPSSSSTCADMALCRRHFGRLTTWEMDFVSCLGTFRRWSPKQLATLARIATALRAQGLD